MRLFDRRQVLGCALGAALAGRPAGAAGKPDFSPVHRIMARLLEDCQVAGGALAVLHRGEVVVSRGYGLSDVAKRQPVRRGTLFSVGSVTKSVTAVGLLKLVDDGKLDLDAKVVRVLDHLEPPPGERIADPRFRDITVRHLLYHAGGLPRIDRAPPGLGKDRGTSDAAIKARYRAMLSRPLEYAPGTEHRYSNAGFLVLRLVLEKASGRGYEEYCREKVLAPMGIKHMRMERPDGPGPDETHRYLAGGRKPAPYHASNWLASAEELARLAAAAAGSGGKPFLSKRTTEQMLAAPSFQAGRKGPHVGLGWDVVRKMPGGYRFGKDGAKAGVEAWLQHLEYGVDWAVLFNTSALHDRKDANPLQQARKKLLEAFAKILGVAREDG